MLKTSIRTSKISDLGPKVARGVRRGMFEAAAKGFDTSQDEVAKDRGTLLQSGVRPTWVGDTLVWGYTSEYAEYVEEGTEPHYPPIEPLKGWARRVLNDESAAYAVQEKIGQDGTEAQPYVEPGVQEMRRELRSRGLVPFVEDEIDGDLP